MAESVRDVTCAVVECVGGGLVREDLRPKCMEAVLRASEVGEQRGQLVMDFIIDGDFGMPERDEHLTSSEISLMNGMT